MVDLTQITTDVAAQNTVVASVQTLLTQLTKAVNDLKSQVSNDPQTQAAISALVTQLEANTKALSDAVAANTPSA